MNEREMMVKARKEYFDSIGCWYEDMPCVHEAFDAGFISGRNDPVKDKLIEALKDARDLIETTQESLGIGEEDTITLVVMNNALKAIEEEV